MPAQPLSERTRDKLIGHAMIPANPSSQMLVKQESLGEVDFKGLQSGRHSGVIGGSHRGAKWVTVAILVYVNLINYMDRLTIAGILDKIQKEFNANDAMMGLLQTAFIVSYMFFAPLFGYLGDRYSRKAIMATGVFLWAIFTLIGSFMSGREEHKHKKWGNPDFWAFMACRAMVGIGEASYSTIAPTIISDMFVKDMRSKMLALFYFAIPVGSGMGYIVGAKMAELAGSWQWGLRATPFAGILAVLLIVFLLQDPPRGQSEGHEHLQAQTYGEDLASLCRNSTFLLSTLAFTCVTFCTGALSWWGPVYIEKALLTLPAHLRLVESGRVALIFGFVTMMSGVIGVPLGMYLSTKLKAKYPRADPLICGCGILISALFLTLSMLLCRTNLVAAFVFLFLGEVALNLNWSIVADMLLYVVVPTCRSTAEAVQILFSHAFGDAGSPYLIGLVSDGLRNFLDTTGAACGGDPAGGTAPATFLPPLVDSSSHLNATLAAATAAVEQAFVAGDTNLTDPCLEVQYSAMQYSLLTNTGVEVLGGLLFFLTAVFIVKDKLLCEKAATEYHAPEGRPEVKLMLPQYSPDDSLGDEVPSDDEAPQLIRDPPDTSRSTTPV